MVFVKQIFIIPISVLNFILNKRKRKIIPSSSDFQTENKPILKYKQNN